MIYKTHSAWAAALGQATGLCIMKIAEAGLLEDLLDIFRSEEDEIDLDAYAQCTW